MFEAGGHTPLVVPRFDPPEYLKEAMTIWEKWTRNNDRLKKKNYYYLADETGSYVRPALYSDYYILFMKLLPFITDPTSRQRNSFSSSCKGIFIRIGFLQMRPSAPDRNRTIIAIDLLNEDRGESYSVALKVEFIRRRRDEGVRRVKSSEGRSNGKLFASTT